MAWDRRFNSRPDMLRDMKQLRIEGNKEQFQILFHQFCLDYENSPELKAFLKSYGENGHVCAMKYWARCFNLGSLPHNLHIERYHKSLKEWELKPDLRIDKLVLELRFINDRYHEKEIQHSLDLPMHHKYSKAQEDYLKCHANVNDYTVNGM